MTVKELIDLLSGFEPNRDVIMAKDAEGNAYSPLSGAWPGAYRAETSWYGDVGLEKCDEDDVRDGYTEEDVIHNGTPALILTPIN